MVNSGQQVEFGFVGHLGHNYDRCKQQKHGRSAEAHRLLFLRLLRTPLRALCDDAIVLSQGLEITAGEYVEGLRSRTPELLPADLGGGYARHFSSVLQALSILV